MNLKRIFGWLLLIAGIVIAGWTTCAALILEAFFYGWPPGEPDDTWRIIPVIGLGLLIAAGGLILLRGGRSRMPDRS